MSTRCQICRSVDRWNGSFCLTLTGRTVQYKHNAQFLRLFGLHGDVNDAHRAGANRLQNKNKQTEVQQWDTYPEPTELRLVGYLTELIWTLKFKSSVSTPNTNLQTCWQREISHVMSGTIFFILLTSPISALSAALRISDDQLHQNDGKKDARTERRQQDRGKVKADDEPGLTCLDKFFNCESECVEKPGDTQSILSNRLVKSRETWRKKFQSRRSVEFSRMAKRCSIGRMYRETCPDRRRPGTPELSWRVCRYRETCRPRIPRISRNPRNPKNSRRLRRLGSGRQWQILATKWQYFFELQVNLMHTNI